MTESVEVRHRNAFLLPPIAITAVGLTAGMIGAHLVRTDTTDSFIATILSVVVAIVAVIKNYPASIRRGLMLIAIVCAGYLRAQLSPITLEESRLKDFFGEDAIDVSVSGKIVSMPVLHRKPLTALAPRMYGPPQQSRFVLRASRLLANGETNNVDARCRTYVSGRAAERLSSGDQVTITGRLDWPKAPGNPGEFDFPAFLLRKNIDAMLFVDTDSDVVITKHVGSLDPRRLLSNLRSELYRILARYVNEDVRGIANALLLGSRHELPPEIQHAFMASGTMHLLAISGLHVGILWIAILQLLHVLLVRRQHALLIALFACVVYALLTDLRPSVLRATIFLAVFVAGQFFRREQRMPGLLGLTATIMLLIDPTLVLDVGTWLSFLSVAALGWLSGGRIMNDEIRDAPPDAITPAERLRELTTYVRSRLLLRYQQTFNILLFTTPLVASTFHVFSPIGIILNIALIPLTALVLCAGFATLSFGLLLPAATFLPGFVFSSMLSALVAVVARAADIPGSHLFLAELPIWFLPAYYIALIGLMISQTPAAKRIGRFALAAIALTAIAWPTEQTPEGLRCTVLDVGQGNAVVLECPTGEVVIVDAGAEGRALRSADAVSNYLWSRGHRRVDAIVISHPDLSHCNALPGILSRFDVGRVMLSPEFLADDHPATFGILDRIRASGSKLIPTSGGDTFSAGAVDFRVHQLEPQRDESFVSADEHSLVVEVLYHNQSILLPGDLKGAQAAKLYAACEAPTVLLASGHGSKIANPSTLNAYLKPQIVIVSSRNNDNRDYLTSAFSTAESILLTSDSGAITVRLSEHEPPKTDRFRAPTAGSADADAVAE